MTAFTTGGKTWVGQGQESCIFKTTWAGCISMTNAAIILGWNMINFLTGSNISIMT